MICMITMQVMITMANNHKLTLRHVVMCDQYDDTWQDEVSHDSFTDGCLDLMKVCMIWWYDDDMMIWWYDTIMRRMITVWWQDEVCHDSVCVSCLDLTIWWHGIIWWYGMAWMLNFMTVWWSSWWWHDDDMTPLWDGWWQDEVCHDSVCDACLDLTNNRDVAPALTSW